MKWKYGVIRDSYVAVTGAVIIQAPILPAVYAFVLESEWLIM